MMGKKCPKCGHCERDEQEDDYGPDEEMTAKDEILQELIDQLAEGVSGRLKKEG